MRGLVTYEIDGSDTIVAVGGEWGAFAAENGAPHLATSAVGRELWAFVDGASTRHMYQTICQRVRDGHVVAFPHRCDSPGLRRYMRMRIQPVGAGGVRFESEILVTRSWPAGTPAATTRTGPVRLCSWCRRVHLGGQWVEPEVAIERLGMFVGGAEWPLSHALCPDCAARIEAQL